VKKLFFLCLFFAVDLQAGGPIYRHLEPEKQIEFENVYQDMRSMTGKFIQNSTNPTTSNQVFSVSTGTIQHADITNIFRGNVIVSSYTTNGEITQPLQPSFLVTNNATNADVTGDGTVYFVFWPTEVYDQGNDFESGAATGTFTAPVAGRYLFTVTVTMDNILVTHTGQNVRFVTSNRTYLFHYNNTLAAINRAFTATAIADMDANDTCTVAASVAGATKTVDIQAGSDFEYFSGSLLN
jgi:hypothetical protein